MMIVIYDRHIFIVQAIDQALVSGGNQTVQNELARDLYYKTFYDSNCCRIVIS
jgi:hypothetical protein